MIFSPDRGVKPWERASAMMTEILDGGIVAESKKQEPRDYLGMSRLGEECARKLFYEYHKQQKDDGREFGGQTLRIFQRGHTGETRMADYLRQAGFKLLTETAKGGQFGAYIAKDPETGRARIAGHCDGVLTEWVNVVGLPQATRDWALQLPFPMLWENKAIKNKNFKKYQREGIKKANPVYYAQMQLYMAYLELAHALFTAENQDTCEIFAELVPFDAKAAQEASDRGVMVIGARHAEELPRITSDKSDFRCAWCDYFHTCWQTGQAPTPAPTPVHPLSFMPNYELPPQGAPAVSAPIAMHATPDWLLKK